MSDAPKQATWGGRFSEGPAELMQLFSESVSFDKRLAPFDIQCSKAHSAMLAHVGLINEEERDAIHAGLDQIAEEVAAGNFTWKVELEDVHMNIEQVLTERVPAAAKLHTARSRNDQVATDMRLFFKDATAQLSERVKGLLTALLSQADATSEVYIPGYTHLQRAQPVSMAHHLLAYVEMLGRDLKRIAAVSEQANWCPLGAGAIAGTTLPIDREFTAKTLGFVDAAGNPQVSGNSMDSVSDRDLFLDFAHACGMIGLHLSRLAEDFILWCSSEFMFVDLPQAFCTGSSLMPQKKNPDAMELIRGKSGRIVGALQSLYTMVKGLPLTYNRDLQEDKPPVFDAFDQASAVLAVATGVVAGLKPIEANCAKAVEDAALLATDVVDYLVLKGVPFRKAHHIIGAIVALAEQKNVPLHGLSLEDVRGVDEHFEADWVEVFDVKRAMLSREKTGMPGPEQVKKQIASWRAAVAAV